jgi:prophage DNA circulation protein
MLLRNLQPASFRGARFLVPNDEIDEGRNAISHEYPDASYRYVEDNGVIPARFRLRAVLHGDNLPGKLSRLRTALMRPGPGVLKHPYLGTQFVQVDGTYSVTREDRDSGVIELDLKFAVTGAPIFPGLVSGIPAVVSGLVGSAITAAYESFLLAYRTPASPTSAVKLKETFQAVGLSIISEFGEATDAGDQIHAKAGTIAQTIGVANPYLVPAFRDPFGYDGLTDKDLVDGFQSIIEASDLWQAQADLIPTTTVDWILRRQSVRSVAEFVTFAASSALAEAMAGRTYTTSDEVDLDEQRLLSAYNRVIDLSLEQEHITAYSAIYVATSDILSEAAVRLPKIAAIPVVNTPASVLAYQLYEADGLNAALVSARAQSIVDINENLNPTLLAGDVSVLTEAA